MAQIYSIINNKGGTGKTTTAVSLSAAFARRGASVLLVDLDSQCNLSTSLSIEAAENHVGKLLLGQIPLAECLVQRENLQVIPSAEQLLDFEFQISSEPGREYLLREALENVQDDFDYVIIDCPPSLGTLSVNSLVASDFYIVPMQPENFAFIGLDKILAIAHKVQRRMNTDLQLGGILFLRQSRKTKFSKAVIASIKNNQELAQKLFETTIRQDISLMEASAFGKSIFEYAPNSRGAEDYLRLAKEIEKHYGEE